MTGTRPTRARQLTAVAVLSLLLAALPATAWADHGDRGRGDGGRETRGQFDRQRDGGDDLRDHDGRWTRDRREVHQDRDRRDRGRDGRHDEPRRGSERDADDDGFVLAASVQVGRDEVREDDRRSDRRPREQAEPARRQQDRGREAARPRGERERQQAQQPAAPERRAEQADRRNRLELDRVIWGASTEAQRQADELERDLRRWLEPPADERADDEATPEPSVTPDEEPRQDETEAAAPVAAAPTPPADAAAVSTPATDAPEPQPPVAAPADSDLLAHERGVVDRTFRAGGALLRDTGRAVVSAIPPRARTFSIPLGLVAALGGYLVVQRRFRPGVLPMSAAALPDQEGARERHRL